MNVMIGRLNGRQRVMALFAVIAMTVSGVTFASDASASPAPRTWTMQVGQQSPSGSIQGMAYGAPSIWINVGDSIRWNAASDEIHTVSFLDASHPAAQFSPGISYMTHPTPQAWISKPGQFRNSGLMALVPDPSLPPSRTSYTLKFTGVGTYRYLCYVHGQGMSGTVYVRRAGTPYLHAQAQYDYEANLTRIAVISDGLRMWDRAFGSATSHHIFVGADDMRAMLMRYVPGAVVIKAGESITFDMAMNAVPVPHTVTFGTEPSNPATHVGNAAAYAGGDLNSGVMLPPGFGPPGSSTFTVTFTTAGTYAYKCMLHDGMGMRGTITVQ